MHAFVLDVFVPFHPVVQLVSAASDTDSSASKAESPQTLNP